MIDDRAEIQRLTNELEAALVENAILRVALDMIHTSAGAVVARIEALDRATGKTGRPYEDIKLPFGGDDD